MDANDKKVNVIFNATDENTVYKIPAYQREYIWDEKNWEFFINDIKDSEIVNGESHFLGSIIVIKNENSSYIELVDGQQRLTTIVLAFVALRKATEDREIEKFEDMRVYSRDFVVIKNNKTPRLIPSEQKNDSKNFNLLLQELKLIPNKVNSDIDKNSNIYKAYAYFLDIFSLLRDDDLNEFYSKLITTVLIEISVTDYRSANRLFESLNNRGQELTPMDLIKNMIFAQIKPEEIFFSIERWNKIITYVKDAKTQERFLRHYYNAFSYKEEINVLKKKKITKSKIIDAFMQILKNDNSQKIFDDLYKKSQIYGVFEASDTINDLGLTDCSSQKCLELKDNLFELKKIGATPAYTYLLYLFTKNIDNEGISVSDLIDITNILKKYSIRRSLTNTPPTNTLDDIYINLVEKTEEYLIDVELKKEYKLKDIIIATLQQNIKKYASNDSVLEELKGDIYIEHKDLVKVLLIMYENYKVASKEKNRDLWGNIMNQNDNPVEAWTIEHILPQKIKKGTNWLEMLSSDKDTANTLYNEYLNKFGNLTLTAYNANLSNKDFEAKKIHKDQDGNIIGYQSPRNLKLNEDIKNQTKWSEVEIKERGEKIIKTLHELLEIEISSYTKNNKEVTQDKEKKALTQDKEKKALTQDMFRKHLIKKGDKVSIKNYPNSTAEIIDGKNVNYNGKKLSFNQWGKIATGWKSIQIYAYAYLEENNKMFEELRKEV